MRHEARRLRQMLAIRGPGFASVAAVRAAWNRVAPHWIAFVERHEMVALPTWRWRELPDVLSPGLTASRVDAETWRRATPGIAALFARPPFRTRIEAGDVAYVCQHGDTHAGSIWVAERAFVEPFTSGLDVRFVIEEPGRTVWDYELQISPRYRLTPVLNLLSRTMLRDLEARGVEWTLSSISVFNLYSRHVHDRLRPVRLGHVLGARVLGATFCLDDDGKRIPRSPSGTFDVRVRSRHLPPATAARDAVGTPREGRLLRASGLGVSLPELVEAALAAVW